MPFSITEKTFFCSIQEDNLDIVTVMVFECQFTYFPPLKNFNDTWNHLILVTNERIKREVRCWMTFGSTCSWGSVRRCSETIGGKLYR